MIYTFNRDTIEEGLTGLTEPYALISISTPKVYHNDYKAVPQLLDEDNHEATLPADENRLDVLRLAFWDVDRLDPQWGSRLLAQARLYSTEDARRVAEFVKANLVNLVIHCDAGISRSQGMANAIADHLDVEVKHMMPRNPRFNAHVYRLTWEALRPSLLRGLAPMLRPSAPWGKYEDEPLTTQKPPAVERYPGHRDPYQIRFTRDGAVERYSDHGE